MAKKQGAVKEAKNEVRDEAQALFDSLIGRIYLVKKTGVEMLEGIDAEADIKSIQQATGGDDTEYTFYETDGRPVYIAIKNGHLSPLPFPEPGPNPDKGQTGMTSIELYGLAVTLASTIEKIIELETQPKPSLIDQAKRIMTPTIVIVAAIVAVFLIVVMMGG